MLFHIYFPSSELLPSEIIYASICLFIHLVIFGSELPAGGEQEGD